MVVIEDHLFCLEKVKEVPRMGNSPKKLMLSMYSDFSTGMQILSFQLKLNAGVLWIAPYPQER